jgi:F-type H+-transporting ATPase subunit b
MMFFQTIAPAKKTLMYITSSSMIARRMIAKRIVRAALLALLIVSGASVASLRAQEQPASSPQPSSVGSQTPGGPGRQLAHESKEAAGTEKDEMEEFKRSASVQAIARLTGLSLQHAYWLSVILNFVVIAAAILWAGRKYLPGMFRDRSAAIQKAMQEAQMASEEARRRLAEIESRLMKLDGEIGMMRNAAEKEGAAEEARIQAAAEEDARKIVTAAEQEIAAAAKAARRQLTAYAADLAVGLARKQIHVDAATDQTLVRNFAGQLGASSANSGGSSGGSGSGKDRN